ncbi:MAG: LPS-assembly protein LptD [Candidatus Omnitrophica bacterium]|nr:LPS-assembly protein LptD [Candidatus Omnitrophota bacterium]
MTIYKGKKRFSAKFTGILLSLLFVGGVISCKTIQLFAQEQAGAVEINGDQVEFSMEENKVIAKGNVEIVKQDVILKCDRLEFYRETKIAIAEGNVVLIRGKEKINGDRLKYNFETMQGDFEETQIAADPFFGIGEKIIKVSDNHLRMEKGRLTTCDLDKPHFAFAAKKIDIYPGEKAVARNVRLLVGRIPIFFMPRFTQNLDEKKPAVIYTPGYDGDWGAFLLTKWRYKLNEYIKGAVHLDYRQRKDLAWGVDMDYKTLGYGKGILRTYYMNERNVNADHFFDERIPPTTERERYRIEWRHKWNIDNKTNAIMQYSKLRDGGILKDYFERQYDSDVSPDTYFILTRAVPLGTLSFQTDVRINRFDTMVERLPEISYDIPNKEIGDTGFYIKNTATYSNMVYKTASPSEVRPETMRLHNTSEVAYPFKFSFIELKPFVGGDQTYYSRTKDKSKYDVVRGIFRTGADLSTKFYRIFDYSTERFGLDINRLRHIITPSISYLYTHDPTIGNDYLDQFDAVDARTRGHVLNLSLENKLQTKRNDKNVDLVRIIGGTNFLLKEDAGKGGFNSVTSDIDINPYDWLKFSFDSSYSSIEEHLASANFDLYINDESDRWHFNLGKRYNREVDDQLTSELSYKINSLWKFEVYERFDLDSGTLKEQEYTISRDLHCWTMDVSYNQTRGEGDEIWIIFKMKAFPEIGFDGGTGFNRRKAGSQHK